ncbi:ABC transporter ATP-binding protein [Chloroflexota bacterium]
MSTVIKVENLSKQYRLGAIGGKTLSADLNRWWARLRQKPDPTVKIGQGDHGNIEGETLWALRDINFEVQQGEVLGIIGRNGAGKSTLLKILSRITAPTSGLVKIKGRIGSLLEVGTGFHPELTGRENIYLNGAILGMGRGEVDRKFDEIVDFSGVENFIDTPVKRYSSGMYVRLAFAVAAHLEPEILLVDEVLAVGDAEFQKKCLGKMGNIAKQGRTVLFVSHNMAAVRALCEKTLLLRQGQTIQIGSTEEVLPNYFANTDFELRNNLSQPLQDRGGNGLLRFTKWSVLDDYLGEGDQVGCNNSGIFKLKFEATSTNELSNVSVAITIKDMLEQPLFTSATHFTGTNFTKIPAKGEFICKFEKIPLIPGIYKVHLWCSVNNDATDIIRDAGSLSIVPNDVYGTGLLPRKNQGVFITDYKWHIKPDQY